MKTTGKMFDFEMLINDKLTPHSPQRTVRLFFLGFTLSFRYVHSESFC